MSFSADKVSHLKGAFSQRRFSSSKDPTESGMYFLSFFFTLGPRGESQCWAAYVILEIEAQVLASEAL